MVKLKIADTIIGFSSKFPQRKDRVDSWFAGRYKIFFSRSRKRSDIRLEVRVTKKLPEIGNSRRIFTTYHLDSKEENWSLSKNSRGYVYQSPAQGKEQVVFISRYFNRATAYLLPKPGSGLVWSISDLIYDFLLVLLMNYFARRKTGIVIHGVGVKDSDGRGFVFAGKSGSGKSTTARIWHKYTQARVLNDDRMIIRKIRGRFFIFGSPWHGGFSDYLDSSCELARLDKFFFIRHWPRNTSRPLAYREAMSDIYPLIFPTFWDKGLLDNLVLLASDLIRVSRCFNLGFVANKRVIKFVREIK